MGAAGAGERRVAMTTGQTFFQPPERPVDSFATPRPAVRAPEVRRLVFHGAGGTLFGIQIVNVLLVLATLGVCYFWGKSRVRRYLVGQTEIAGDRFAYHGTGGELLRGFLKALAFFGLPLVALSLVPLLGAGDLVEVGAQALLYAIVVAFVPIATIGARRYRLSRISWRGIRFSFHGSTWRFVGFYLLGWLLTALTLGVYYPVFRTRWHAFMVSHTRVGQSEFRFDGRGRELIRPFLVALLLTLPTLGLCWFWYQARARRYLWAHTVFATARLRSTITGRLLLNLTLGNVVLLVVTLGAAWPWVVARRARFHLAQIRLVGALDPDAIVQNASAAAATGDSLSGFFSADFDLA